MKLLTRKQQDEALKRLSASLIIMQKYIKDEGAIDIACGNIIDAAVTVGGLDGASKVLDAASNRKKEGI